MFTHNHYKSPKRCKHEVIWTDFTYSLLIWHSFTLVTVNLHHQRYMDPCGGYQKRVLVTDSKSPRALLQPNHAEKHSCDRHYLRVQLDLMSEIMTETGQKRGVSYCNLRWRIVAAIHSLFNKELPKCTTSTTHLFQPPPFTRWCNRENLHIHMLITWWKLPANTQHLCITMVTKWSCKITSQISSLTVCMICTINLTALEFAWKRTN